MTVGEDDDYVLDRGYQDSTRLVLQHWLWVHRLNYVFHPSIPTAVENLKIADVGTGNAVWIIEALPHFPASTHIDGFDISSEHYPAKEWVPPNVSLNLLDAYGDIPGHLVGRYDIVHLRMFGVIVKNNDPTVLLANLVTMLKPGGYIQWDEMDEPFASVVNPSTSKAAADEFLTKWKSELAKLGIMYRWISNLGTLFREHSLCNLHTEIFPPVDEQRKIFNDNGLMALRNVSDMLAARAETSELGAKSQWRELFEKMVMETKKGASIAGDFVVVIGQKPELRK